MSAVAERSFSMRWWKVLSRFSTRGTREGAGGEGAEEEQGFVEADELVRIVQLEL
jgi:hypothetical protein